MQKNLSYGNERARRERMCRVTSLQRTTRRAHTSNRVGAPSQRYFKIFCTENALEVNYFSSVSPPETSETFCLPAETKGIISRRSAPIFSIGWFLPASRS